MVKQVSKSSSIEPNLKHAVTLVTKMMAIPGKSGQEMSIMNFITQKLRGAGLPASAIKYDRAHKRSHINGEVGNLIVKMPAGAGRRSVGAARLLTAHVDTVPLCVGSKPTRRGRWIRSVDPSTALGADNRSGAAALLSAAVTMLERKLPHPPATFAWLIQEEIGLIGAKNASLRDLGRPRLAFNYDSGQPANLIIAATGAYRIAIEVEGVASHAGVHPELGVNAITIASMAIAQLQKDGFLGTIHKGQRTGTSNVGMVQGGEATNVVTPHVSLRAEVRSHNPRFRKTILNRFNGAFERAAKSVRNELGQAGKVRFESQLDYEAFRLGRREPCVVAAQRAVRSVLGKEPVLVAVDGGLDANWLTARGIPTVTIGAGQHGAHTVGETLNVTEFEQGCRIALRLATGTEND
ncbi:MAG: peptidase M20 [Phycisphaeraceae bacterium]|nr:peptidase M20 [Phycisphaeraceae bacterium]